MKNKDEWSRTDGGQVLLNGKPYIPPFVRKAMKGASEQELEAASENLRKYIGTMYQMFVKQELERREIWRQAEENRWAELERLKYDEGRIGLS